MTRRTWTGGDAQALRLGMELSIEEFAARLSVAPRTVAYWASRPDSVPRTAIQELLDDLQWQDAQPQRRATSSDPSCTDPVVEETERFLAQAAQVMLAVGPEGIDLLSAGVQGIARTYTTRPLVDEFNAAAALQRRAATLLTQTSRPGEITDLYVAIAQLGALMASCAFDMGRPDEAFQLTSAALLYAARAGDPSLTAWILGLRASLDLWGSRPTRALASVDQGLATAPPGQPSFRLRHIGARAAAAAGDRDRAVELLRMAAVEDLSASTNDRLADEVGGEFLFDLGRAAACASATWLMLGDWEQVMISTQDAIDHYNAANGSARVPMLGARLDLASALVQSGDIQAAGDQLEAAFGEAAEHRYSLVARVDHVARQLHGRRAERHAADLYDNANQWLAETTRR